MGRSRRSFTKKFKVEAVQPLTEGRCRVVTGIFLINYRWGSLTSRITIEWGAGY